MGIGKVIGEAIGGATAGPLGAIGPVFTFLDDALTRAFPDKTEQERIKAQLMQAMLAGDLAALQGQLEVNKVEAGHSGNFVAGWRPFIGWICGAALAFTYIGEPVIAFGFGLFSGHLPPMPVLDTGTLMDLLVGMLGLAGMRSYEKVQGVADKH
jgi:holin (3TMs family)